MKVSIKSLHLHVSVLSQCISQATVRIHKAKRLDSLKLGRSSYKKERLQIGEKDRSSSAETTRQRSLLKAHVLLGTLFDSLLARY